MGLRLQLLLLCPLLFTSLILVVLSDPILHNVDTRIDLTSHIVRISSTIKVENEGNGLLSTLLVALTDQQASHLAFLSVFQNQGKHKVDVPKPSLPIEVLEPEGIHPHLTFYSISLPRGLFKGETLTLEIWSVFTNKILTPFPEHVPQGHPQLILFEGTASFLSPYAIHSQKLSVKLPNIERIEFYTQLEKTRLVKGSSEIKYGPYHNQPSFTESPISIHFEYNKPIFVAHKLVREIDISHWGNVQITEHYNLILEGSLLKGGYSRLDYQSSPQTKGFSRLVFNLHPGAHSVYYRDEIGNISTSHLRTDQTKTELEIEPRFPLFGGWRTSFTIGYGLPLKDYLFKSQGKRFLNFSFGSPLPLIHELVVKVIFPEGSSDISASVPFPVEQWKEKKHSHLDIGGRPVIVLRKTNVVPEHNQHFQVYYWFNSLSLLREPLMLIFGFMFVFLASIGYTHADLSISKSSPCYLAKLQREEVQVKLQQLLNTVGECVGIHDKLEICLQEVSRTGDLQAFKARRKPANMLLKELILKELKPLVSFLQSCPQAAHIFHKADELVAKEQELVDKYTTIHSIIVDCYERKLSGKETESRVAAHQQKITSLRKEVDSLVEFIDGSI